MQFARFDASTELVRARFDLQEPADPKPLVPTVVLVPLVAFDRTGIRLGRGGGFYDRYLADRRAVHAIGVAHAVQAHESRLPREAHDVVLTKIATERGWVGIATEKSD